jgi:hypothetical protein
MFPISPGRQQPITDVYALEGIEPAIRLASQGRYQIDEIPLVPLPSCNTSRRWGAGIKRTDGSTSGGNETLRDSRVGENLDQPATGAGGRQ